MAKIKVQEMIIEITYSPTDGLSAYVLNIDTVSSETVINLNRSLEQLIEMYSPAPGEYVLSITNAIADWLVDGFGEEAEVVEYDNVRKESGVIN